MPVSVATAKVQDMPVYLTGLGSVSAFNTVSVKTRVDGQLVKVAFKEGQHVNKERPAGGDRSAALSGSAGAATGDSI